MIRERPGRSPPAKYKGNIVGKITGFMEFKRQDEHYLEPAARLKNYKEFVIGLTTDQAKVQAARCMDCGTPFCNNGCPVNNIIPDFNDLVYHADWKSAIEVLHSTNNFPEFTGRICPAPCEAACVLNVNDDPVGIKSIEHAIIDRAWAEGWVQPRVAKHQTGKKVAVVGSGPAGMAAAQQLARAGHSVTLFEKNDRVGGLLRYGIPDFKMEKSHIDRRVQQMQAEGVTFRTGVFVGAAKDGLGKDSKVTNWAKETITPEQLNKDFDAVLLTGGAEQSRDLPVPGRDLDGIHFAMEFLPQQNKINAGDKLKAQLRADGKKVASIHLRFLQPMQPGIKEIMQRYKKVLTIETNWSDNPDDELIDENNRRYSSLATLLRSRYLIDVDCWTEVRGQPVKPRTIRQVLLAKLEK